MLRFSIGETQNYLPGGNMKLDPSIRGLFGKLAKKVLTVTHIAELFDTTRQTVHR